MSDTLTTIPPIGAIYDAWLTWRLADGGRHEENRSILILDAERLDNRTVRVVWKMMADKSVRDYLPVGEPRVAVFEPSAFHPEDSGIVDWRGIEHRSCVVILGLQVDTYTPRDPKANGIEILRQMAVERLELLAKYPPA
jgi:hypothetical protein